MHRAELAAKSVWREIYPGSWSLEPVDLSAAAGILGVRLYNWTPEESKLSGALVRSERAVFVNAALSLARARFTAAHEMGHFVLGHAGDYFCYAGLRTPQEREANIFAASLLMPAAVVKSLWLKLSGVAPHAKAAVGAKSLGVSRQAFGYRLVTLGLATRNAPWA